MATWYVKTYICDNGIEDKTKFPVPDTASPKRLGNRGRDRAVRRAEKGATEAKHELARLLNCNFSAIRRKGAGKDRYLTLEYDKAGFSKLAKRAGSRKRDPLLMSADHEARNFIRRCQRACEVAGVELRYAYVTSDLDGKSKKPARVHHHLVVNAEAAEICRSKWTGGETWDRELYGGRGGDLGDLAAYMIGQTRYIQNRKKYTPSRNLKKARPTDPIVSQSPEAELRVPKGCALIWRAEARPGRPQHIRYWRPPAAGEDDLEGSA